MSGHQGKQGDNSDQNSENKDIADKLNAFNCYFNWHNFKEEIEDLNALKEDGGVTTKHFHLPALHLLSAKTYPEMVVTVIA